NPQVASQMGQFVDKLKSVLPEAPGIQDLVDDLENRLANMQENVDFGKVIQSNAYFFDNPSTNEVTVGPEDVLGEFESSVQDSHSAVSQMPGPSPIDLEREAEDVQNELSYLRSELGKADPDELGMFRSLMKLPAGEEVQVLHYLRTNGDVDRLFDDL